MKNSSKISKLKKGDEVKVVVGKDKGKTGKIEKVMPDKNAVLVTGVNQYKRHFKARAHGQKSEIVTITKPLGIANIALVCPKCHLITRAGFLLTGDSKKRICRKCKGEI